MRRLCSTIGALLLMLPGVSAGQTIPGIEKIIGTWVTKAETPNGPLYVEFEFKLIGNELVGFAFGSLRIGSNWKFQDPEISGEFTVSGQTLRLTGVVQDNKISGAWMSPTANIQGNWSAERKSSASASPSSDILPEASSSAEIAGPTTLEGTWSVVATRLGGDLEFQLRLKQDRGTPSGSVVIPDATIPLQKVQFLNNVLTFEVDYAGDTYGVEATLAGKKLSGKWSPLGSTMTGAWRAERKGP